MVLCTSSWLAATYPAHYPWSTPCLPNPTVRRVSPNPRNSTYLPRLHMGDVQLPGTNSLSCPFRSAYNDFSMLLYPGSPLPRPPVWTCWSACQGFPDVVQRGSGFRRDNELISRQDPVSSSQQLSWRPSKLSIPQLKLYSSYRLISSGHTLPCESVYIVPKYRERCLRSLCWMMLHHATTQYRTCLHAYVTWAC